MTAVTDWTAGFLTGLTAGLARLFSAIPNIIGAILVLIIGWIIAGIIGGLVTKVARAIKLDLVADRIGVNAFLAKAGAKDNASTVFGEVVKWVVRLIFVEMAAEQLGMAQITTVINQMLGFIPNIIVAMVILGAGAFLGQLLAGLVRGTAAEANVGDANLLAKLTSGAVMAFAVIMALNELNIAPVVVNTLFIGLVAALSLALGLAFGLGGKDVAGRYAERWTSKAEELATSAGDQPALGRVATSRSDTARVTTSRSK